MKVLVQCDFDGTVTEEDISFLLLDVFAQGDWRRLLRDYKAHRISVGEFNTGAFAMVKADKDRLLGTLEGRIKVRAGFRELANYCLQHGFRLVIVSNGLDFYIRAVLEDLDLADIEMYAAQVSFDSGGMKVQYIGPDGKRLEDGFKEAHIQSFLKLGYRVVYIGNGDSDVAPARYANHVFATGDLLAYSKKNDLGYKAFETFLDVVRELNLMQPCFSSTCNSTQT